jgi:beta-glucanase (GH16 family)
VNNLRARFAGLALAIPFGLALIAWDPVVGILTPPGDPAPALTPAPAPQGEPAPIAGQGYTKVFEDNFDTFNEADWSRDIFYENDDPPEQAYIRDGVLVLQTRRSNNYVDTQVETEGKRSWLYGYFECRSKFSSGRGGQPACWLLSQGWANNPSCRTPSAEIDIFEGQSVASYYWIGALHRHSGQHVVDCGGNRINSNAFRTEPFPVADTWHTWAVKWTPAEVCWYLDDKLSHCAPVWDTTNSSPMFLILWMSAPGWSDNNKIQVDSPAVLTNETDWVRVWQR